MLITKRKDVTMQGFCQILRRKWIRLRGNLLLALIIQFFVCVGGGSGVGWGYGWVLIEFEWEGEGCGVGVGANSRLGAY